MIDQKPRLLVVDDDPEVAAVVARTGERIGLTTESVHDFQSFCRVYSTFTPDVIALDLVMPDVDGVEVLRFLTGLRCSAEILLVSGSDARTIDSIRRLGSSLDLKTHRWLQKPVDTAALETELRRAAGVSFPVTGVDLSHAVSDGEIFPFFQPKVNLADGSVCGLEALVRWQHPAGGLLLPHAFLPLAEKGSSILDMTLALVHSAFRDARTWTEAGFPLSLSINLSAGCLGYLDLPDRLAALADEHGVERSTVIFEVTENLDLGDDLDPATVLTRLRLKGFRLAMDDYGTGYSTLVQLARLPFTELKIDRTFVSEIDGQGESRIIVESTTAMAHSMGLTVCAEGVETVQALECVRRAGCDTVQGFLIARPMPGDSVLPFLRSWLPERVSMREECL